MANNGDSSAGARNCTDGPAKGAGVALALLLIINLFNYIDRQVLSAVLPKLQLDASLFDPADPWLQSKLGLLTSAFLVSYTLLAPIFGWWGRMGRRWFVVGVGVVIWSLASGASGLATGFGMLLLTRCLVGIGEAAYGPVAPAMLSDLYPVRIRGKVMAWFYMAIPVGSALGFVIGGQLGEHFGWRTAFLVTLVGLIPGLLCFVMKEPIPKGQSLQPRELSPRVSYGAVLRELRGVRSFVLCCLGMTCTTFVLGGVAAWIPNYIFQREARFEITTQTLEELRSLQTSAGSRVVPDEVLARLGTLSEAGQHDFHEFRAVLLQHLDLNELKLYSGRIYDAATAEGSATLGSINLYFGVIVVISGLGATLLGGWLGDWLRARVRGAYFQVAGWSTILAFPFFVATLVVPFPLAWLFLFVAVFGLFMNTGPANTILANVSRSPIRSTAFAINILVIHMLGDVISPPLIGITADLASLQVAFYGVSLFILLGGGLWVLGARFLDADTEAVERADTVQVAD